MREVKKFRLIRNVIFFLNVFLAFMIISGSWMLVQTDFGRATLSFGFLMLAVSVMLRLVRMW